MKLIRDTLLASAKLCSGLLCLASVQAQPTGQWDFDNGTLAPTTGTELQYFDGPGGVTSQQTQFGTTTTFGIPDINGTAAKVMKFPATDPTMGYVMPTPGTPNGGGGLVNDWTLIMDVLYPAESTGKFRAIVDIDGGLINADAEFFINDGNGIGINGSYSGTIGSNTWYRIAFVVEASTDTIRKYINGTLVGTQAAKDGATPALDGRWSLSPSSTVALFYDNDNETAVGYVNSIQLRDQALSNGQVLALGGPAADGIPQVLPQVPSTVTTWTPSGAYGKRITPLGAVIDAGDTTVTRSTIVLKLDGTALANPQITEEGTIITVSAPNPGLFVPSSEHTIEITYTDSKDGQRTFSHTFKAALFLEDFEGLPLGPNVDETTAGEEVWTKTAPDGWTIDDSQMAGLDDPEKGITEWKGWSFANRSWWASVDDQLRSSFSRGIDTIAIADPDEWDDKGSPKDIGKFNSFLTTPTIDLTGTSANTIFLELDSTWRPECCDDGDNSNNQTAIITASFNGGSSVEVLKWDSREGSPTYHGENVNEHVTVPLKNPAGATNVVLTFALTNAANDWFWAVDNIVLYNLNTPAISVQPAPQKVDAGDAATFTVAATVNPPFTYQWRFNGTPISGATSSNLVVANVDTANAGDYSVVVSNSAGSTTSDTAALTVVTTPEIASQPKSLLVSAGYPATLSVGARGRKPLAYQWQRNGAPIAGATTSNIVLSSASAADAGEYRVVVTNINGTVTSDVARLSVFDGAISNSLVAHLKFDGTYSDASGRGNDATPAGAPTFAQGRIGQAISLSRAEDGTINYATLGAPADLEFGQDTDFSIAFWANLKTWSGDASLIGNKDWDSGNNNGWVISTDGDGRLQWNLAGKPDGTTGDRKDFDSVGNVINGSNWHHVVVTFDRDGFATTYVDSQLAVTRNAIPNPTAIATPPNNLNTTEGLALNIGQDGTGSYGSVFTDAQMDDVGIWRRLLTPEEVRGIYNSGLGGKDISQAVLSVPSTPLTLSVQSSSTALTLTWTGGTGPFSIQRKVSLTDTTWITVQTTSDRTASIPMAGNSGFFRIVEGASTNVTLYKAVLTGAAERPTPINTTATGLATLSVEGDTLTFVVSYSGLSGTAVAAHFHGPAGVEATAPPVVDLKNFGAFGTSGVFSGTITLTAEQKQALAAGLVYVNVHTAINGGGEIRGQVLP